MQTLHISVSEELAELVNRKVDEGQFLNASEVVSEALQLLDARDAEAEADYARMQKRVEMSCEMVRNGQFSERTVEEIVADANGRFLTN